MVASVSLIIVAGFALLTTSEACSRPVPCTCISQYDPVCGEDGKSYSSPCLATCANVKVAYPGECALSTTTRTDCVCPALYQPVCGTDGKTYTNACDATCHKVTVAYQGTCVPSTTATTAKTTASSTISSNAVPSARPSVSSSVIPSVSPSASPRVSPSVSSPSATGSCLCTEEYRPVCGTDNNSYPNACFAKCKNVNVAYQGACVASATRSTPSTSSTPLSSSILPTRSTLPTTTIPNLACICPAVYQPVCGVDGQTYTNACEAFCRGVNVAYQGVCVPSSTTTRTSTDNNKCNCLDLVFQPVCGTDGITYPSACLATCLKASIAYSGACVLPTKSETGTTTTSNNDCKCLDIVYTPVCGTDGVTYYSACLATCRGVNVAYQGVCVPSLTTTRTSTDNNKCNCLDLVFQPVCGTDGITYPSACLATCLNVNVAYQGVCVASATRSTPPTSSTPSSSSILPTRSTPSSSILPTRSTPSTTMIPNLACMCPAVYQPVCGVDGQTYSNACEAFCRNVNIAYLSACDASATRSTPSTSSSPSSSSIPPTRSTPSTSTINPACMCPAVYQPVCGVDGQTHSNDCEAFCRGVNVAYQGVCVPSSTTTRAPTDNNKCNCLDLVFQPVCGTDGITYPSACLATCLKASIAYSGACVLPTKSETGTTTTSNNDCKCLDIIYTPVCGTDGVTYYSACLATCRKVEIAYFGACVSSSSSNAGATTPRDSCLCPEVYQPVCDINGLTHPNACSARCRNAIVAYQGACVPVARSTTINAGCNCIALYQPVCGTDGITYSNSCAASCNKAIVAHDGECA